MATDYVDCDGHVMEKFDELIEFVGEPFRTTDLGTAAPQALSSVLAPYAG